MPLNRMPPVAREGRACRGDLADRTKDRGIAEDAVRPAKPAKSKLGGAAIDVARRCIRRPERRDRIPVHGNDQPTRDFTSDAAPSSWRWSAMERHRRPRSRLLQAGAVPQPFGSERTSALFTGCFLSNELDAPRCQDRGRRTRLAKRLAINK